MIFDTSEKGLFTLRALEEARKEITYALKRLEG